jgi:hypothetical protein
MKTTRNKIDGAIKVGLSRYGTEGSDIFQFVMDQFTPDEIEMAFDRGIPGLRAEIKRKVSIRILRNDKSRLGNSLVCIKCKKPYGPDHVCQEPEQILY